MKKKRYCCELNLVGVQACFQTCPSGAIPNKSNKSEVLMFTSRIMMALHEQQFAGNINNGRTDTQKLLMHFKQHRCHVCLLLVSSTRDYQAP